MGSVPVGAVCSLEYLIFLPYERTETEICKVKSKKEAFNFIFHKVFSKPCGPSTHTRTAGCPEHESVKETEEVGGAGEEKSNMTEL